MKKVYCVLNRHHDSITELEINGPFIEETVEKLFSSREAAEKWIEEHFVSYINSSKDFCDFKVVERTVEDQVEEIDATLSDCCVSASVDANLEKVRISSFTKYSDDFSGYVYRDHMDKSFQISCRLPGNLKTRTEVIDFIKAKAQEINN